MTAPVPVPVVNEYEGVQSDVERIARQLHAQHQDEPVWDKLHSNHQDDYYLFASRVLALPAVAAAFEAQAQLQNAPSSSKDLELAEAQAKLEAVEAALTEIAERRFSKGDTWLKLRHEIQILLVEEGGEGS